MRVKANQDVLLFIQREYQEPDTLFSIEGFYLLRIEFNDAPRYVTENFLGYRVLINGQTFYVGQNGILHLEQEEPFEVTQLLFLEEQNVTIHYEIKGNRQSLDVREPELLDRHYTVEKLPPVCRELYFNNNVEMIGENIFESISGVKGVIIEAQAGCLFNINNNQDHHIMVGRSDFLYYFDDITSLVYLGYKEDITAPDIEYTAAPRELKIKYFSEE